MSDSRPPSIQSTANRNALNRLAPLSIVRIVWKGKVLILLVWLLVTAVVAAYVSRMPATYAAQATVVVDSQKIPDRYVSSTVNTDLEDRLANISQQILSAARLQKIIDDFGLYREERHQLSPEEVIGKMRDAITVEPVTKVFTGSRVGAFKVGFQGRDPVIVAAVANRISNLYVEENLRTREVEAQGTEEFIENQLQQAKRTLDKLEAAVSKYKLEHNGELPQQGAELSSALGRLQGALEANRDAINRAQQTKITLENSLNMEEANLSALSAAVEAARAEAIVFSEATIAPTIAAPKPERLSEGIAHQIELLSSRYGPTHPEMKRLRAELERAQAAEQKADNEARKAAASATASAGGNRNNGSGGAGPAVTAAIGSASGAKGAPETRNRRLTTINNDLQLAQARDRVNAVKIQTQFADEEIQKRKKEQDQILKDTAVYEAKLQRLPIREQEMAQITRDYDIAIGNYRSLLDKRISAGMATAMEHREKSERFEVIDAAQVPSRAAKPNRRALDAAGSVAGLVLGLVLAFGLEIRRDVVLGAWEIPSGFTVLGSVPRIDTAMPWSGEDAPPAGRTRLRIAIVCFIALSVLLGTAGAYVIAHRF